MMRLVCLLLGHKPPRTVQAVLLRKQGVDVACERCGRRC
jgi:hypothetical protein